MQITGLLRQARYYLREKSMRSLSIKSQVESKPSILLVDDEAFNLEILEELLDDYGYQTDTATNGREACEMLSASPDKYAVILLDRMMPEMGGMEVTEFIRAHKTLRKIPIIMQSAKAAKQDIQDGLNSGILYYLTKPFGKNELLSIVDSAVNFYYDYQDLLAELDGNREAPSIPGKLEAKNFEDAKRCAIAMASLASDPEKIVMGLYELLINGIEHGNLGIGYKLKSNIEDSSAWLKEVANRMDRPENRDKKVEIECERTGDNLVFKIRDQGCGFNYREFLEISTSRALNTTGRGIAIARVLCFDGLEYVAPGNQVIVKTR